MWIYWKNECTYCKSRKKCEYRKQTEDYKKLIYSIPHRNIQGSLIWKCDYFIPEERRT